jgi:acyl-coenzyme A synthetase/AMP-(fatty) acid ligase
LLSRPLARPHLASLLPRLARADCILDGKSRVLVCDGERYATLSPLPGLKSIPFLVCRREGRQLAPNVGEMETLLASYKGKLELPSYPIAPEDHAIIFFTSGTTVSCLLEGVFNTL